MRLSKAPLDTALEDRVPAASVKITTAGGFFGVAGVREDRRAAREELREAVERVRELEALASRHSPLFGEWKPPEVAREVGKALLNKVVSYARFKGLGKGAEGEFVKLSTAAGVGASAFNALGDEKIAKAAGEAASAIRRVVEGAWTVVRPVVAIASRALARAKPALEPVGLADEEFKSVFNVASDRRPLYFVYLVGDVEYGAVKTRGVRAVAFVSGAKTLRIEVLAEGVEGLAAERVKALGGEWFRLATFQIDTESGVIQLTPRVEVSARVRMEPILAKHLSALVLTDVKKGGEHLESPDPSLHLLYALAVGEAVVRVARVVFTEAGPVVHLESRAPTERVNWLYEEVARELSELGVVVRVRELRRTAKAAAAEIIGEVLGKAEGAARGGIEELRVKLVEAFGDVAGKAAEKYKVAKDKGEKERALWRVVRAVVAKKFFAENVDDPVWWALLLLGDGVVKVRDHAIGFAAKPAEAAEAVMHVFARVMGIPLEVRREGEGAMLSRDASRAAVEKLFKQLEEARVGNTSVSQLLTAVAEWWLGVGIGGSRPPKLLSFLAFRELAAGEEGKWLGAWLSYEAAVTPAPEELARWLDGVYRVSVKPPREIGAVGFDTYFERGGERFKLYTDFTNFYLSCETCGNATKDVLTAEVGWPTFLKLWARHNMSFPIKDGDRELLRVEVLEARADGTAKFRLWYHKWQETRPERPYVDIELKPRHFKEGRIGFRDLVYANVAEGVYKEHLAEIAKLLEKKGVEGIAYYEYEKRAFLQFTGRFRDSVLARLGIRPELPPGEPAGVQYLGGYKFRIGEQEVKFDVKSIGARREFNAVLKFPSGEEAVNFARSLRAIGVDARVAGSEKYSYEVRLDSDAFFGLLATANAAPPGLTLLYNSEEDDFRVYAAVEGGRMRFYFAVKHEGAWRAVEGLYSERKVEFFRAEREVLEAIRGAVTKALKKLAPERQGRPAEVGEPKEKSDEEGHVVYYLYLYDPHLAPFLEYAAERVEAKSAEVRLEGGRIVISAGGVEAEVEFKLLKRHKAEYLIANDVGQTLALYKSLKEVEVPVELMPKGVKVDGEAMWALVVTAVEKGVTSGLPAEVMPGVELLKVYSAGGMRIYAFRVSEEDIHYYFAVKTRKEWRAAGGKKSRKLVMIAGEGAHAIAEAINAIYREMGVERKVEVKLHKNGAPFILLTNVDLRLLGLTQP